MHRLVIIEDQTAIREMMGVILALDKNFTLVGQCGDGLEGLEMCLEQKPDVVVLDAKLPSLNGVELLRRLTKKLPSLRVLVFSGYENPVMVRQMLEAGAHGFVEKTAGFTEFKKGLEAIAMGGTYFGPAIASVLRTVVANPESGRSPDFLTEREREILQLLAEGRTNKEVASFLNISPTTVETHRGHILRKLSLHSTADLILYAVRKKIIG